MKFNELFMLVSFGYINKGTLSYYVWDLFIYNGC
jgi:hypothetical protein